MAQRCEWAWGVSGPQTTWELSFSGAGSHKSVGKMGDSEGGFF